MRSSDTRPKGLSQHIAYTAARETLQLAASAIRRLSTAGGERHERLVSMGWHLEEMRDELYVPSPATREVLS